MNWWIDAWVWLAGLQGGAPQFLGALTGSLLGLIGILLGALYNAHLNRKRDDRVRQEEARSIIAALRAELSAVEESLLNNAQKLEGQITPTDFYVPDISDSVRILPQLTEKLGILGEDAVSAVMKAFMLINEYLGRFDFMEGTVPRKLPSGRIVIGVPSSLIKIAARLNRVTAGEIGKAIKELDAAARNLKL